ncbi:MAG TPA: Gfo/Idh/MocA family oxidoreductase [Burkholderiales bacterium]|nr:Gfo/Idh/MocA family oxidoreductase [Burkholderiales bacterium]
MIDAAIVGLGRWGRKLVEAVQGRSARLRFVRGAVRHPEAAREFAARHGFALSCDLAEVLADPRVQAVVLATPHSAHVEQVVAAAAAGKAVFCEKPLALDRAGAERAVEACRRAGVALGVGQDKRFWPSMRELARVVESGDLGEILHLEGNSSNEVARRHFSPWRAAPQESPGGSMTATGIHVLDAFVRLAGAVRRVYARHYPRRDPPQLLDTVAVLLEHECGASGLLSSVRTTPFFWRVHVFGERGSAEAVGENELVLRRCGEPPRRLCFAREDALRLELEAFADAVEGRAPYPVSPSQMIEVVAALEAICRSMETGAPVALGARLAA